MLTVHQRGPSIATQSMCGMLCLYCRYSEPCSDVSANRLRL